MPKEDYDIAIVSPGLLEPASERGGGIEEIDYQAAIQLSARFKTVIIGPYYQTFTGRRQVNKSLWIEEIRFPAFKHYPILNRKDAAYIDFCLIPAYSTLVALKSLSVVRRSSLIIVHNGLVGLIGAIIARLLGKQVLFSEGNTIPWLIPHLQKHDRSIVYRAVNSFYSLSGFIIAGLSRRIRAQSNSIAEGMARNGILASKIMIIPGGVDTKMFTPTETAPMPNGIKRVGFVGRLTKEKGVELLIDVIRLSALEMPGIRFIVLGDGPYRRSLENMKNVEHVGWIPRGELPDWFSKMDAVVFFQKELGLAELEAMACGKAVIVSSSPEVARIITHRENGILCTPNARSYIDGISTLDSNSILLGQLTRNARKTIVETYSWEALGEEWRSVCAMTIESSEALSSQNLE